MNDDMRNVWKHQAIRPIETTGQPRPTGRASSGGSALSRLDRIYNKLPIIERSLSGLNGPSWVLATMPARSRTIVKGNALS